MGGWVNGAPFLDDECVSSILSMFVCVCVCSFLSSNYLVSCWLPPLALRSSISVVFAADRSQLALLHLFVCVCLCVCLCLCLVGGGAVGGAK